MIQGPFMGNLSGHGRAYHHQIPPASGLARLWDRYETFRLGEGVLASVLRISVLGNLSRHRRAYHHQIPLASSLARLLGKYNKTFRLGEGVLASVL